MGNGHNGDRPLLSSPQNKRKPHEPASPAPSVPLPPFSHHALFPLLALLPLLPLLSLLPLLPCPPAAPNRRPRTGCFFLMIYLCFCRWPVLAQLLHEAKYNYDNLILHLGNTTLIPLIQIVFSWLLQTVELGQVAKSSSASLIWIIAVLSILLAICFVVSVALSSTGKRLLKISKPRKLTTQSVTSTEMVTIEDVDSPGPVSRTETVTRDNDEVFPYDVIQTWTGSNGSYMSLNRTENNNFHHQVDDPQVRRPDYTNISPSNRNDSAANCMYAPLRLSTVVAGSNTGRRPYVNVDTSEASSDM